MPQDLEEYPEKIATEVQDLWLSPIQILCVPCVDKDIITRRFNIPENKIIESEVKNWINLEKECVYCEKMHTLCHKKQMMKKTDDIKRSFGVLG